MARLFRLSHHPIFANLNTAVTVSGFSITSFSSGSGLPSADGCVFIFKLWKNMDVLGWVIVFLAICTLVSLIATKKGRSGPLLFLAMVVPAIPLMIAISYLLGSNMEAKPFALWSAAFLCPVVGFFWALMTPNKEQLARAMGQYGDLKKCPFCAESVQKEAIKCKHCGSELAALG